MNVLIKSGLILISSIFFYIGSMNGGSIETATTDVLFVVDISQSMNAQDDLLNPNYVPPIIKEEVVHNTKNKIGRGADKNKPLEDISKKISRLDYAKKNLLETIKILPCGWKVSIGIFSGNEVLPLFYPIEVCDNISNINKVINNISWSNIWMGDSFIANGLYDTIRHSMTLNTRYVFITDGDPYPRHLKNMPIDVDKKVNNFGVISVIGSEKPTPIPKFAENGDHMGYWGVGKKEESLPIGLKQIMILERDSSVADFESEKLLSSYDKKYMDDLATSFRASVLYNPKPSDYMSAIRSLPSTGSSKTVVTNKQEFILPAMLTFILAIVNLNKFFNIIGVGFFAIKNKVKLIGK